MVFIRVIEGNTNIHRMKRLPSRVRVPVGTQLAQRWCQLAKRDSWLLEIQGRVLGIDWS